MKKIDLNTIDWNLIQKTHDSGVFWNDLPKHYGISKTVLERAVKNNLLVKKSFKRHPLKEETKNKISIARKKYLRENPDKHPWKRNSKFKSKPCEIFKQRLLENSINFIEEYQPSKERFYTIDVAFPNKMIGIEINGNQHYNRDGTLKNYYKTRNDFFEELGWKIYEIHYSVIYSDELLSVLINDVKNFSLSKKEHEYYTKEFFRMKEESKNRCVDCNKPIFKTANRCGKCNGILSRKVERPNKETLIELIKNNTWRSIGKTYGVSDNAVRKWAKFYELI